MNIPVIIVHRGYTFYLKPVLKQIYLFNPESKIYLIGDESTNMFNFVEHHDISQYSSGLNSFAKAYLHMSSNPYDYELFCFQRWFIIRDFVRVHKLDYFLCLDSDVLLFCNVSEVYQPYLKYDFTISDGGLPHCSLLNKNSIEAVCDYMMSLYTNESNLIRLKKFYQRFLDKNILGGVCDMTALSWYQIDVSNNVINISKPVGGSCFDNHIGVFDDFESEGNKKKIYWIENLPYGRSTIDQSLIRFNCLHLQGRSKYSIFKYVVDDNKVHHSGFLYNLKWSLSKEILGARLKGIKKAIQNPRMVVNFVKAKLK